ncbi:MAG: EamA family transporter [bacterium]|nr:EamA family transporter [bacterium]
MSLAIVLLVIGIILGVIAQLALKEGITRAKIVSFRSEKMLVLLLKMFWNKFVLLGCVCYAVSLLLWLVILSKLELSYAYPMISSGYFFVALGSYFIFKEKISWQRWMAIGIIIFGVVLVGLS